MKGPRNVKFTPSTKKTDAVKKEDGEGNNAVTEQPGSTGSQGQDAKGKGLNTLMWDTGHFFIKEYDKYDEMNSFEVENTSGLPIYHVYEIDDDCAAAVYCLGTKRCFSFKVTNTADEGLFYIRRDCSSTCSSIFCGNCPGNSVTLTHAGGLKLGKIRQKCGFRSKWSPTFEVFNKAQEKVLTIKGPKCGMLYPCGKVEFQVNCGGEKVGTIRKHWPGVIIQGMYMDAKMFGAEFSETLDADTKSLLLGAIIFIDFIYFGHGRGIIGKICGC